MMKLLRSLFARIRSRRSSPPAGEARSSADGASPLPDPSSVELANENTSLRAQLALAQEEKSAFKAELDIARAQHELDMARIGSLESMIPAGSAADELVLVNTIDRAGPSGGHNNAAKSQELNRVESIVQLAPLDASRALPIELLRLIFEFASSHVLTVLARARLEFLGLAIEELARRPIVFDIRKPNSGIDSFIGIRERSNKNYRRVPRLLHHSRKYRRITFVIDGNSRHPLPDPSKGRSRIAVDTLVLNLVNTPLYEREVLLSAGPYDLEGLYYSYRGLGKLLSTFKPDVFHNHADFRGLPPSSVGPIGAIHINLEPLEPTLYRAATVVYSGCTPVCQRWADRQGLVGWMLCSNGDVVWNMYPAKIVFILGGAHRDGVGWEYVDARDDEHFNPANPGWIRRLDWLPTSIGMAHSPHDRLQRPDQQFEVELWVDKVAVQRYQHAFDTRPLFAMMETSRHEPIRWTAVSLQDKLASTVQWEADVVKGLGGIDRD